MAYPSKPNPRNLRRRCHGYGTLTCYCGGDLCVCGLDGEECLGCPDCEGIEEQEEGMFFCSCGAELRRYDNPQQCACLREHDTLPTTEKQTPAL